MDCSGPSIFTLIVSASLDANGEEVNEARVGLLQLHERMPIKTPSFFPITSRGVVPHLTPDVVSKHSNFCGVHLALEDYIERATKNGTPPIMNGPARKGTPLHTFTALSSSLVTLLTPRRTPAVSAPNGNTNNAISLFTSVGFQPLSGPAYSNYTRKLKPDIVVALGDVTYGSLPGVKRQTKMGDRTSDWVDLIISDLKASESTTAIFAPVLPVDFHSQYEYLHHVVDDLADSISGLAFYDSSLLPDIPATTTLSLLPRLSLDGPSSPRQILRQISLGMDLFVIPFIGFATDAGLALTFEFACSDQQTEAVNGSRVLPLAIDLSSTAHARSVIPLLASCSCYACTAHHRAYIQHLLSSKEMLGWVLLQIHNHAVMDGFFAAIRTSIESGNFEADKATFESNYESELPEGNGQRPRARGYHFKTEGPGEKKKNKPAWGALGEGEADADVEVPLIVDEDAKLLEDKGLVEVMGFET